MNASIPWNRSLASARLSMLSRSSKSAERRFNSRFTVASIAGVIPRRPINQLATSNDSTAACGISPAFNQPAGIVCGVR